jgi:hypothetical protein
MMVSTSLSNLAKTFMLDASNIRVASIYSLTKQAHGSDQTGQHPTDSTSECRQQSKTQAMCHSHAQRNVALSPLADSKPQPWSPRVNVMLKHFQLTEISHGSGLALSSAAAQLRAA